MKKLIFVFILLALFSTGISAQDITGSWFGVLEIQYTKLRLVVNIEKTEGGYSSTIDSPDQGAKGIPATSTRFENSALNFVIANIGAEFTGKLTKEKTFVGEFTQGGAVIPLTLSRNEVAAPLRPQEPKPPFPYYSEYVTFENSDAKATLAGTLTLPKKDGIYPVVVLISGSGPQNRDEELFGHKPFLVLADHLTRNGIGVLRFDDRGVGESRGDFGKATSEDFATDVESAVNYLTTRKDVNKTKIGLIGHSEGGIIAPMVAAKSKDVAFIVLLAGTGIAGDELLLLQKKLIEKDSGVKDADIQSGQTLFKGAYEIIKKEKNSNELKAKLKTYFIDKKISEKDSSAIISQLSSVWMRFFIRYDPSFILSKVKIPVFALNGEKDLQVPAEVNLMAIEKALRKGGNNEVTIKEFPNLNHLFQESKSGSPSEYAQIEQTFSPVVLSEISNWIIKQTK